MCEICDRNNSSSEEEKEEALALLYQAVESLETPSQIKNAANIISSVPLLQKRMIEKNRCTGTH